jgi:hydroxymethylbilane synthase
MPVRPGPGFPGTGKLIVGTRGSELALWQSRFVQSRLSSFFPSLHIELIVIKTLGDKILDSPLAKIGGKGLFTKELEKALLEGSIDVAVHSMKDIPTQIPEGLQIGAITEREDVHDIFIAHPKKSYTKIEDLPQGAKIATGSLRRRSQLLHWRSDLVVIDLRGNLNTRLKKLEESNWDGMILARAGIKRLGWEDRITQILPFELMLPAVGQGALGIELRFGDERVSNTVSPLHHFETAQAVLGERSFLRYLEGGCQIPIGTHGRIENGRFVLDAVIGSMDGTKTVKGHIAGDPEQSESLGKELAAQLLERGGREILHAIRSVAQDTSTPGV